MKKHSVFDSIYTKFLFQLLLLTLIPTALVIIIFSYNSYQNTQNSKYELNNRVNASIIDNINNNLEYTAHTTQSLLSSSELISFLKNHFSMETDYDNYISSIQNYVQATVNTDPRSNTYIYMENSTIPMSMDIFYHLSDIAKVGTITDFLDSNSIDCWLCGTDFPDSSNPYLFPVEDRFIYLRKAYDFKKNFLGLIVFSIPENYFLSFDSQNEGTVIAKDHTRIINLTGDILSEGELSAIVSAPEARTQIDSWLVARENPENFPFTVITVTQYTNYEQLLLIFLLILVCFAFFSILLCMKNIRQIVSQMNQCLSAMNTSISNNYKTRIPVTGNNEISDICRQINLLLNQAAELSKQNIRKETSNKESRLIALQHQINPHFIYNTMEVFSSKMKLYGHYDESDAMVAFANIFRYNISTNDSLVMIREELQQSQNYLNIQKLRYPSVKLQSEIPDGLSLALIPKFTFQPIIENAISHGMNDSNQKLTVMVTVEKRGDFLLLCIEDNGAGMLPRQLESLTKSLNDTQSISTDGHSVGLKNVNTRLILYFGASSHLRIESVYGTRTRVTFRIPHITDVSPKA